MGESLEQRVDRLERELTLVRGELTRLSGAPTSGRGEDGAGEHRAPPSAAPAIARSDVVVARERRDWQRDRVEDRARATDPAPERAIVGTGRMVSGTVAESRGEGSLERRIGGQVFAVAGAMTTCCAQRANSRCPIAASACSSHSEVRTGRCDKAWNVCAPTKRCALSVIATVTSQPASRKRRTNSALLYAAMPPHTQSSTRREPWRWLEACMRRSFLTRVDGHQLTRRQGLGRC